MIPPLLIFGSLLGILLGAGGRIAAEQGVGVALKSFEEISHAYRLPDPTNPCIIFSGEKNVVWFADCSEKSAVSVKSFELPLNDRDLVSSWIAFWVRFRYVDENILSICEEAGLGKDKAKEFAAIYRESCQTIIESNGFLPLTTLHVFDMVFSSLEEYICNPTDTSCKSRVDADEPIQLAISATSHILVKVVQAKAELGYY